MTITMNDSLIKTINELKQFLQSATSICFKSKSQKESYAWIKKVLKRFRYFQMNKIEKGVVRDYIGLMTRYSQSQITRLIAVFFETEDIQPFSGYRRKFPIKYLKDDLVLLAQTDELHGFPQCRFFEIYVTISGEKEH